MKIAVCSDLHLEFGDLDLTNDNDADVLILGGDIFVAVDLKSWNDTAGALIPATATVVARGERYYNFIKKCTERFPHVILITGNHEHYHGDFATTHDLIRATFDHLPNLHFLDKEHRIINGVVFYGGTLWTDMNGENPITMSQMQGAMNDYYQIKNTGPMAGGKFLPQDSVEDHFAFRRGLDAVLEQYPDMPTVVVGHHAPSKASTHPRYKSEFHMNGAYSTNLDDFILDRRQIRLWTHGHTHEEFDYMIGTTRVVCNPRGYDGYENRAFDFELKYWEIQ
jgi:Icc-related predicted phosphoesterase